MKYQEIEPILDEYETIINGYYRFFARAAWETLEKQRVIEAVNKEFKYIEQHMLMHTVMMIFQEFYERLYEESFDYAEGLYSDEWLADTGLLVLAYKYLSSEERKIYITEDEDGISWEKEALYQALLEVYRKKVMDALFKEYSKAEIFTLLYVASDKIFRSDEDIDEYDYLREEVNERTEEGYDRYKEVVNDRMDEVVNTVTMEKARAYAWLDAGTLQVS